MIGRVFLLSMIAGLGLADLAMAAEPVRKGNLEIAEPWARATAPQQANAAAFLVIRNSGPADRLVAAKAALSRKVELHTHVIDARGVAQMREIPAIELPADSTVKLEPGGLHVMFIGLERPLKAGDRFPLTLVFEKAGEIPLEVEVRAGSGAEPMHHGAGRGMQHHQGKSH